MKGLEDCSREAVVQAIIGSMEAAGHVVARGNGDPPSPAEGVRISVSREALAFASWTCVLVNDRVSRMPNSSWILFDRDATPEEEAMGVAFTVRLYRPIA
jgi:hypothetical protein